MKCSHILISIIFLFGILTTACEENNDDNYDYIYQNDYLRDTIISCIDQGIIGVKHLFVINEDIISESEIDVKLSSLQQEDIISIEFINKVDAIVIYGTLASDGVVKINSYEEYSYQYQNDYIRDTVLYNINQGIIGARHLFKVNEKLLGLSEIESRISSIARDDIISIRIISKSDAFRMYGASSKQGIVKINYYIDPLLKPQYYITNNKAIMDHINDLIDEGKVVRYPLIVLDGKPLLGNEIKQYLDALNIDSIKIISVMDLNAGLQVFGERAINGVVIINTKYY